MTKDWPELLFVEQAELYLTQLEWHLERAETEADSLVRLFSAHGLNPPAKILDLCCGIGRHSVALAKRGFQVVGVDFSQKFLARAQKLAEEHGVQDAAKFVLLDARKIAALPERGFAAIINIFTSFGYYDEETDRNILAQARELTNPGGIFVLDLASREWILRNFSPTGLTRYSNVTLIEERKFDFETSRHNCTWRFFAEEGEAWRFLGKVELSLRMYSLHELIRLFESAGWRYRTAYGDLRLSPYCLDSRRVVVVAENPG